MNRPLGVATGSDGIATPPNRKVDHERPFGPRFVTPLFIGSALNPINSSMIAIALVSIAGAMHVADGQTAILISSLYLTSAIAQPVAGRLSEEFGPRRVFLVGIVIVLVAGIIGGLARDMPTLVVARVLIGLGTSAGYPSAMLLVRRRATAVGLRQPPGSVLGGLTTTSAATLAIGPTIGGVLIVWFDWRAVFWINVPVSAIAFVMALLWIAKDTEVVRGHSARDLVTRVDLPGVAAFGGAITALLVFLLSLPRLDWIALGISVAVAAGLVVLELRVSNPFLDIRLLVSNLALTRTYVRYCLTLLGIYVVLYGLTQWTEAAHHLSGYQAGLALIPMGVLSAVIARVVSRFTTRLRLWLMVAVICVSMMFGLVAGFGNVTNQTVLYVEAPAEKVGTASGLLRTFGYIGSIAAATITGVAFRARVSDTGLHLVAVILIGTGLVVVLLTLLDRQLAVPQKDQPHSRSSDATAVRT